MSALPAETLSLHGPEARAFAHAQFSSDIQSLPVGQWQWSGWLDPNGRVRNLLQVARPAAEHLLVLLRGGDAATLAAGLSPYVLRAQLTVTAHAPQALIDAPASTDKQLRDDAGGPVLGMGGYAMQLVPVESAPTDTPAQAWRRYAIDAGHPWLPTALRDSVLAPALSLQQLGGVTLDKGCFPGQEVVARLHYRAGGGKQQLARVALTANAQPGAEISADGKTIGHLLDCVPDSEGCRALAILPRTELTAVMTVPNGAHATAGKRPVAAIHAKLNKP